MERGHVVFIVSHQKSRNKMNVGYRGQLLISVHWTQSPRNQFQGLAESGKTEAVLNKNKIVNFMKNVSNIGK
jgi:hypothetical protein